jgi:tetratricopeptide (TPR) repeat protein
MGYKEDFNFALSLKNDNKYLESIKEFQKIEQKYGETPELIGMIALIYYSEINNVSKALEYAKRSIVLSPKSEMSSLCLFHCLYDLGKKEDAEKEILRFIKAGGKIKNYNILFKENDLNIENFVTE